MINMQLDLLHGMAEFVSESLFPSLQAAPQAWVSYFMLPLLHQPILFLSCAPLLQSTRNISGHDGGHWSGPFNRKTSCLISLAVTKIHLSKHQGLYNQRP